MASLETRDKIWRTVLGFYFTTATTLDCVHLYPKALVPAKLLELSSWYYITFNDQLFLDPKVWFKTFSYIELFFHVPMCAWLFAAIGRKDHRVPTALMILGGLGFTSTLPCVTEMYFNTKMSAADKMNCIPPYICFVIIFLGMMIDGASRANAGLAVAAKTKQT